MSSKPQLVGIDSGVHNSNLDKTRTRLMKGGSWKRQNVVMVIPAAEMIPTKVYLSHCGLIFPPNNGQYRMAAVGMEVGEAFSNAIEQILLTPGLCDYQYLLSIEHDNIPPPDGLIKLLERMENHPEYAAISGAYFTKGEGGVLQAWGDPKDSLNYRPQLPDPNGGLVECNGLGMGFCLFRLSMFKDERLRRPWFKTLKGEGGISTQDLYFWGDAKKNGYRCCVDCSVRVGHYDYQTDTNW